MPPINARILARRIPNAELEIVPDAGHLLLMDHAETLAERIAAFLGTTSVAPHKRTPEPRRRSPKPRAAPFRTVAPMVHIDDARSALATLPDERAALDPTAPASTTIASRSPTPSSSHASRPRPDCSPRRGRPRRRGGNDADATASSWSSSCSPRGGSAPRSRRSTRASPPARPRSRSGTPAHACWCTRATRSTSPESTVIDVATLATTPVGRRRHRGHRDRTRWPCSSTRAARPASPRG